VGQIEESELWNINWSSLRPSSSNIWPTKYKFIGIEVLFTQDLLKIDRSTYDLLNFFSDVGGLDFTLYIMGYLIMNSYAVFNSYSYLMTLLFLQSNNGYQAVRNMMKHR